MRLPIDLLTSAFLTISASWSLVDILCASAALTNVTIDDTFGDQLTGAQIVYDPPGVWELGQDCSECAADIDRSQVYNGTWHNGTFSAVSENGGASNQLLMAAAAFEGVAVYVYCILLRSPIGRSDMTFYIDGVKVGNFVQEPTRDSAAQYDVPVYANNTLPSGNHTIAIVNGELNGDQSLTLLDYILYTRDISSTGVPSSQTAPSLTPTDSSPADSSASPSPTAMADSGSSRTRTIVIATVASIAGILVIVALIIVIIYCGRRRYRSYNAPTDGVIAQDAARIEDEDPGTSGWVEGTWASDDDSTTHSSRRTNSTKRKRDLSNARSPVPPVPATPSNLLPSAKVQSPTVPPATVSGIPTFRISPSQMSHARADPAPLSPTSSFGNLASTVPDSATYLLSPPASSAAFPKYPNPSDTFLDMSRSYADADADATGMTTLSSHNAHPFATAQAVAPSSFPRQQSGRDRSDSNQSNRSNRSLVHPALTAVPPSASSGALSAAQRGHARGPAKKTSGSDLGSSGASNDPSSSPSSTALQTLPSSTTTTPTSTTMLMPRRQPGSAAGPSGTSGASVSRSQSQSQSPSQTNPHSQSQTRSPPRRVDPIDPAMQPPRELPVVERERRRERERERQRQREPVAVPAQAPAQRQADDGRPQGRAGQEGQGQRSGRRQGLLVAEQDRQRLGNFLDVPVDASESRPPSYPG